MLIRQLRLLRIYRHIVIITAAISFLIFVLDRLSATKLLSRLSRSDVIPQDVRPAAFYRWVDEAGQVKDGTKPAVYGVFVLLDLVSDTAAAVRRRDHDFGFSNCHQFGVSGYHLYLIFYVDQSPAVAKARRVAITYVYGKVQQLQAAQGCHVTFSDDHVKDIKDRSKDAYDINWVMMDAYLDDGVDFFLLIFPHVQETSADDLRSPPPTPLRNPGKLANILQRYSSPVDTGVVLVKSNATEGRSKHQSVSLDAMFFTRVHFDIFGLFFSRSEPGLQAATRLMIDVYSAENLTTCVTSSDTDATSTMWSRGCRGVVSRSPQDGEEFSDLNTLRRYLRAVKNSTCFRCPITSSVGQLKVISMSLYGASRRYTMGAVRNSQLAPVIYPGWQLRFYCHRQGRHGAVPSSVLVRVQELGAEIIYVDERSTLAPMFWRFTVVDDPNVDIFIVRDADSRLTPRDAAVVADWLMQKPKTTAVFHCVRDHPSHSEFSVSGGLWGARRSLFAGLYNNVSFSSMMSSYRAKYVEDMKFLGRRVWPRVRDVAYCHDSYSCRRYRSSHPFPVRRQGTEHLGQVYDQFSVGRAHDMELLSAAPVNVACVPSPATPGLDRRRQ